MTDNQIIINNLSKIYDNGFDALKKINLNVKQGEILAMLGPNGAGKTTLISIICGIVTPSSGTVTVDGFDIIKDYRETRSRIGMVPQELNLENFETVFDTVSYSRGLYGKSPKPEHIEKILKDLSLWDKKNQKLRQLSGGMKRRVLIAKALSHEPKILFLDEPTAGVDVELRKEMWKVVDSLRKTGVTIILTTSHISFLNSTSTLAVGSSKNNIFGSCDNAFAINTLLFIPPESSLNLLFFLSHNDSSFNSDSIYLGFEGFPYRPLV